MEKQTFTFKKSLIFLILCITIPVSAQNTKTLTILHTNDIHSRIEPIDSRSADMVSAGKGGYLRIASYVEETKKENPTVLLFDCGDFSQGTPYYNLFRGEVEIEMMNIIGYDAGTIGNHEFDYGLKNMANLFRMANFPIVCCNYDVKGTVLEGLVKPYIILKKNGLKIGILGVGTKLEGMVQADKYAGLTYEDPYEKANETAEILKKKGCDLVICLSHLGLRPSSKDPVCDINLAKESRNIDIILGGHSHTLMEEPAIYQNMDGQDVYISQMGRSGIFVGRLDLTFK